MSEYKQTLNLPKTPFPMKASLAQREPAMLKTWDEKKIYQALRKKRAGEKKFILHDGPPYANGHLHCGHALNKILKDIVVKAKSLSGYDAPFVPGWDCHGLPIEHNVEKKVGKAGSKISLRDFRQQCREYAASQVAIQKEEFKRFGVLADWQNPYITMDFHYEANIIRALGQIIKNGHLQQGFKPVHWCLDCTSALAEAEVEYEEKVSPSIDVRFIVKNAADFFTVFKVEGDHNVKLSMPIWTTTPWTLPANQAVSINAELDYALVYIKDTDEFLILATELVKETCGRYGFENIAIKSSVKGKGLEGLLVQHPLYDKTVPVICGEHVNLEAGTGCVHTAPAHGPDDYLVGIKYQLPMDNPVLASGCYADNVPLFAGMHVKKADTEIIAYLEEKKLLVGQTQLSHSYPHCWRHKTPVIFRATPQWFIAMDKAALKEKTLKEVNTVTWLPKWGQARIYGMIENRPDWCVSRQRAWGTPIPLFIKKRTGALHPDSENLIEKVALLVEKEGIDAWFELDKKDLLGNEADNYDKVTDTLDVWFDSGVSHFSVLKKQANLAFPADLYLEGSDQHRGWFNSSITSSVAINGQAPFKTVLTHGFTVDAKGKKMSKSKGNYIAPEKLINQSGADILRLWVASTDYRGDVHLSDEIYKRTADAYRRIRNTCRFLLANLFDFDMNQHAVKEYKLVALDKWAIAKTKQLQDEIIEAYETYQFHVIYQKLHNFCAVDMGSFYLDIIKDRQYTAATNSIARRSCQTAMHHILAAMVRWLAPVLSFTADEIWSYLSNEKENSVFLTAWYDDFPVTDTVDFNLFAELSALREVVNKAIEEKRNNNEIGSGLEAEVTLFVDDKLLALLKPIESELRFVLITSKAYVYSLNEKSPEAYSTAMENVYLKVQASKANKCERCWHRLDEVGQDASHGELCQRCIGNITGKDEVRLYA